MDPKIDPSKDRLYRLKYIGYCLSQGVPDERAPDDEEFLNFAKFQICQERKLLMKDPIWDTYSDQELLVEYFAIAFALSEEERTRFKQAAELAGGIVDWMDAQIEKNKPNVEKLKAETPSAPPSDFEFTPKDALGE